MAERDTNYRAAVKEASAALVRGEDANWELARLTFENTLDRHERNPAKATMAQWCADVRAASGRRFSQGNGERYKAIWRRYSDVHRDQRPIWADAYEETFSMSKDDREDSRASFRLTTAASPETKRETFKALAADPDVASDPEVQELITDQVAADRRMTTQVISKSEPERATPVRSSAGSDRGVVGAMNKIALMDELDHAWLVIDERTPDFTALLREGDIPNGDEIADDWLTKARLAIQLLEDAVKERI